MKRRCVFFIHLLFVLLISTCSKDSTAPENGDANISAELVGNWNATQFLMTETANPSQQVDLIQFGISFSLAIQSDGRYSSTMIIPGDPSEIEAGTCSFRNNQITIDPDDDSPYTMNYTHSGNTLTFTNNNSEFDFDDDGIEEAATATIVLQKHTPGVADLRGLAI